jgi:hypothetical protein
MGEPVCQFGGTYPYCWDEPNPPPPTPDPCADPYAYGCGSGGGGGGGSEPTEPSCNPYTDSKCYRALTTNDREMIASVTKEYWRPLSAIADAAARQRCESMQGAFNKLLSAGSVYRGGYDTRNGDGSGTVPHYGAYYPETKTIHYDASYLDTALRGDPAARRQIAKTSLHEAAHALGHNHNPHDGAGNYAEAPFNLLSAGPNSCIAY